MHFIEIAITPPQSDAKYFVIYCEKYSLADLRVALCTMGHRWFQISSAAVSKTNLPYPEFAIPEEPPHPEDVVDIRKLARVEIGIRQYYCYPDSLEFLFPHLSVEILTEGKLKALHRKMMNPR